MYSSEQAVELLRLDSQYTNLLRDAYLDADVKAAANRFWDSGEFAEVRQLVGPDLLGKTVVDLGAGTGIASFAFAKQGAPKVYAVEPDPSPIIGRGAVETACDGLPVTVIDAFAEDMPLDDQSVDVVYMRQVLHHIHALPKAISECARILKPGGVFIACREHVIDNERQLQIFLDNHPIHQLAGGENAYQLDEYLSAIAASGLHLERVIGPWDSVINAFPGVRTLQELERFPRTLLHQKLGIPGLLMSFVPGVRGLVWKRIKRPVPGRMYSFLAVKP